MANQATIIQWLENLIPDINSTGNPEQVLTKFATRNNLAPAQLTKLGQVFNAMKTLSYQDKNPDQRWGSFKIIDVPSMVSSYESSDLGKSAHLTVKEASKGNSIAVDRLPDFINGELPEIPYSAHLDAAINATHDSMLKLAESQSDNKLQIEILNNDIDSGERAIIKDMDFLEQSIKTNPGFSFKQAHQDLWYLKGESVADSMAEIADWLNRNRYMNLEKAASAGNRRLVKVSNQAILDAVIRIHETYLNVKAAKEIRSELEKSAVETAEDDKGIKVEYDAQGNVKEPTKSTDNPWIPSEKTKKEPKTDNDQITKWDVAGASADAAKNLAQFAGDTTKNYQDTVVRIVGEQVPQMNVMQRQIDDTVLKTRHDAVLNQLLMNDDILKDLNDSEEEVVIDTFNTIARVAPEIAADPTAIRPLLRQANEYGGITPTELKNLIEMEKNYLQGESARSDISQAKYRV
jgi:hypothetical protein